MKVLLTTLNAKYIHLNLAIRILYELNKHYEGLEWKEYVIRQKPEDIAQECAAYDVVAFSCYIWNITQTLKVAECIKTINPSVKILLGGPEVSYEWEEVMANNCIDYIICGEGEIPFHEFLTHYPDVTPIPNLVHRMNGEIHYQEKSVTYDLSNFIGVNPYINDPVEDLYNKVAYIETSRGCPYKCGFCLASLDNNVRYLPMTDIKKNLLYLMTHGRVIKFLDRTFNMKRDFTLEIFQFILDNHKSGNIFQFEITADILHPDIIKFINEQVPKNLFRFEIGIQTVNQKANLEVSRRQNFEKTKSIIKQVQDKVELHLDLIVGLPLDYFEDIKYSFEEVFKLFAPELQLGFLKFLKGTPVRRTSNAHGYVYDPVAPYQIIESNYLSKEELRKVTLVEEALEIYWNKNRARHTLKYITAYYSIFDFLLGLGSYFEQHSDFHKHSLRDIYDMLYAYVQKEFPADEVLQQLVTIDFYLHHKIKPVTRYYPEVAADIKQNIIEQNRLNHHKNRYIVLPVKFNYNEFLEYNQIIDQEDYLVIEFDGKKQANVLTTAELMRKENVS
ncbi:MAG: radical SAM proteinB12-binding domain-containing radical SAM protein [Sphingobacteriales bacterium]|nr:MAG: radical SAM proteinB12-binding domain-containing radical SAM protein [Sphingobacteriales bacterium]